MPNHFPTNRLTNRPDTLPVKTIRMNGLLNLRQPLAHTFSLKHNIQKFMQCIALSESGVGAKTIARTLGMGLRTAQRYIRVHQGDDYIRRNGFAPLEERAKYKVWGRAIEAEPWLLDILYLLCEVVLDYRRRNGMSVPSQAGLDEMLMHCVERWRLQQEKYQEINRVLDYAAKSYQR